jgi:hypothetical protein
LAFLKVILDDFPDEFLSCISQYNDDINELFLESLQNEKLSANFDFSLPLSKYDYGAKSTANDQNNNRFSNQCFEKLVFDGAHLENRIVSNFAALSGLHDKHSTFHMKNKSLLIHLKSKYLSFKDLAPTIQVGKNMSDFYGNEIKLNSYFLDFYNHGIYASILNENKIREEYIYDYLKDFKQILSYLKMISMNNLDLSSLFLNEIKEISLRFDKLFDKADFDKRRKF